MGLKDDKKASSDVPSSSSQPSADSSTTKGSDQPAAVWIFGYGSLLWKTNFPYQTKVIGHVKGYVRRFWQASCDHRGTPEMPGRVATLVDDTEGTTWGLAYKVDPKDVPEVMAYLNKRESGGYTTKEVTFYPQDDTQSSFTVLLYIATCTNPNYLGHQTIDSLARCVVTCQGQSGHNIEYVLELAKAMNEIAPHVVDEHLMELSQKVTELIREKEEGEASSIKERVSTTEVS